MYIVLGATHPHVLRHEGETYRLSLQWLAREKGVEGHVIFYNRFVSLEELVEFIGAADIYITPYLNAAQIISGTLAYTLGAGKAVISTPYWYAEEMLADERGVLVPFQDPAALASQVIDLLDNEAERHAMRKRAYLFGREMIWPQVAHRYRRASTAPAPSAGISRPPNFAVKTLEQRRPELPPLKLDHLRHMTDETGMLQHALFTVPNYREGYTTDDNARALMVSALLEALGNARGARTGVPLPGFIWYAFNADDRALPQLHGLRPPLAGGERFGRQPRPRAVGAGHGAGPLEHARAAQHGRPVVRAGPAGDPRDDQPARVGVRAHRHPRVPPALRRRPARRPGARGAGRAPVGALSRSTGRTIGAGSNQG